MEENSKRGKNGLKGPPFKEDFD